MTTTRVFQILGAILVLVGLLGFVQNPVLGIFGVNALHNLIHLLSGALLLYAAMASGITLGTAARTLGIIYAVVAIAGFIPGLNTMVDQLIVNNVADTLLHAALAVLLLYIGFVVKAK